MNLSNGDLVEVSNDEEGFRGAWFCARLVKKQGAGYLVEYRDLVNDEDDTKQLRERVDKLHIRPSPPEQSKDQFIHNHEPSLRFSSNLATLSTFLRCFLFHSSLSATSHSVLSLPAFSFSTTIHISTFQLDSHFFSLCPTFQFVPYLFLRIIQWL